MAGIKLLKRMCFCNLNPANLLLPFSTLTVHKMILKVTISRCTESHAGCTALFDVFLQPLLMGTRRGAVIVCLSVVMSGKHSDSSPGRLVYKLQYRQAEPV